MCMCTSGHVCICGGQRTRPSSLLLLRCFNLYTLQCECYEGAAMKAMDARAAKAKAAALVQGAAMKAKGRRACQGDSLWMHPCSASWPGPMPSLACRATAPLLSYVWALGRWRGAAPVVLATNANVATRGQPRLPRGHLAGHEGYAQLLSRGQSCKPPRQMQLCANATAPAQGAVLHRP